MKKSTQIATIAAAVSLLAGCGSRGKDANTIRVAASVTPHAEILESVKPALAAQGYNLEIRTFEDYVQPNLVVESGEFDANYMEHAPYLESINAEKGLHLVSVAGVHYEPFGIYPGTKKSLADLADGDAVAVPNDTTNEARALLLLEANGVLKLREGAGLTATKRDVESYAKKIKLVELEAAQVARVRGDVAFAVLNGNYALQAGLSVGRDAVAAETPDSAAARTYVNVLVVKDGRQDDPALRALASALLSPETAAFIRGKYDGAVVPFAAQ